MNLATMRTEYRGGLAGRVSDLVDADVDRDLNESWQFEIADMVLGDDHEDTMALPLTPAKDVYDVDSEDDMPDGWAGRLRQIEQRDSVVNVDPRWPLVLYKRPESFNALVRGYTNEPSSNRPRFVLWYSRKLTFWPVPAVETTVEIHGTYYHAPLTADGLSNDVIARAVVNLAVLRRSAYRGFDDIEEKFTRLSKRSQLELRRRNLTAPRERIAILDF